MNFRLRTLVFIGGCASVAPLLAVPAANPYEIISTRNAFRLNPPPVVAPVEAKVEPPAGIDFTGFSQIGNERKAWFVILPRSQTEQPQYLSLREGERSGPLELKQMFTDRDEVKVVSGGRESTIGLKKPNGVIGGKPPGPNQFIPPGAPPPMANVPPPQVSSVVANGQNSVVAVTARNLEALNASQQPATAFSPRAYGVVNGAPNSAPASSVVVAPQLNSVAVQSGEGLRNIPQRTLRISPVAAPIGTTVSEVPARPVTHEESVLGLEIQRELTRDKVARQELPPLPPSPVSDGSVK